METQEFTSFLKSNMIWFLKSNGNNNLLKTGTIKKVIIPCGNKKKELFSKIKNYVNTLYKDIEVLDDYTDENELLNHSIHQDIKTQYFDGKSTNYSSTFRVYYM